MEMLVLALVLTACTILAFSQKPRTFARVPRTPRPPPAPTWTAEVSREGVVERTVELQGPVVKIGSDAGAHLRLEATGVQRFHAVLELEGASATLVDLGTNEGTALNGERVHRAAVKSGDRITVGPLALTLGQRS
ncbi:MAG: FHA domain-containing protein [Deltaproteobacteria bacterium]|nr:FHA domain-containing protein [Deltaproteobacteria bacterium]